MAWVPPGTVGKYRIVSLLGRGGMGEVWKAHDPALDRHVAVKLMIAGEHASEEMLARFEREARLAAKLDDPGVVRVYDAGSDGRLHYFVMELVDGRSLKQVLDGEKPTMARAVRIAIDAARALQAAHELNIVHRDVKPGNIMIDGKGRVRVADFGLAKDTGDSALTASGAVVGTPNYMAPEQAAGGPVTPRTDIYALGAVLFEMLAGRPPFQGAPVSVIAKLATETPPPVAALNPRVPAPIAAAVMRALSRDPAQRFATAEEFAQALSAVPAPDTQVPPSEPSVAPTQLATPGTMPGSPPAPSSNRTALVAVAMVAIVAIAALVVIVLRQTPDAGRGRESADTLRGLGRYAAASRALRKSGATDADTRYRALLDGLAGNPLRWAAAGAIPLPTAAELDELRSALPDERRRGIVQALLKLYAGDEREAWRLAQRTWLDAPEDPEATMAYCEVAMMKFRWSGERDDLARAVNLLDKVRPPETPDRIAMRTAMLVSLEQTDRALAESDRLLQSAPGAAESHLVKCLYHQGIKDFDGAREHLRKAHALDAELDDFGYGALLVVLKASNAKTYDEETNKELAAELKEGASPLAHLVRAWRSAARREWDDIGRHMAAFERTRPALWPAIEPGDLHDLAAARGSSPLQFKAAMMTLLGFGRFDDALAAGKLAIDRAGEIADAEAKRNHVRDVHYHSARAHLGREDKPAALTSVAEALAYGATVEFLEGDYDMTPLRELPEWEALMKRHRK